MQSNLKNIGTEKSWEKIKSFCAYQERTHREVLIKLKSFGINKSEAEQLQSRLIEEDYLNEERFAITFAGGKFRMNKWGKVKIAYELKLKGISTYCIKKALSMIPEQDYLAMLKKIYESKRSLLKDKNPLTKKTKITSYLIQKGYEREHVYNLLA